jgi:CubicO group peptidase (beta-lactamase class C family)
MIGALLLAAAASAAEFPVASPEAERLSSKRLQQMDAAVRSGEFKKIGSVLVARRGKLVHEAYFEGDRESLRNTRSVTKSVTAMLVGVAIDHRLLPGVSAPAFEYLQEWRPFAHPDARKERIKIEDLLTMSSALDCNDWVDSSPGNEELMYPKHDWVRFGVDLPLRDGRGFSYCTAGVMLFGAVLVRAVRMPVDRFAERELFAPLGIAHAKWARSPRGQVMTGGGLELRSRDLLKLAELWRRRGKWNGKRIVSAAWVDASVAPHARIDDATQYGYLFWLKTFTAQGAPHAAYFMSGNGGNKIVVVPDLNLSAVITTTNFNAHGMHQQTERLLTEYVLTAAQ